MYLDGGGLNRDGCIPAKLFEYIGIKKPIFALVPPEGSAAEIIRMGQIGEVISSHSYKEMKDSVRKAYFKYKKGNGFNPNVDYLKQFERRYIINQIVEIFNELLKETT
jgi:hypothetical protein